MVHGVHNPWNSHFDDECIMFLHLTFRIMPNMMEKLISSFHYALYLIEFFLSNLMLLLSIYVLISRHVFISLSGGNGADSYG